MRVSKFLQVMLGVERPDPPDGEDHRAVRIQGLSNYVVKGVKEYNNAVVITVKKKEKYVNDRR